MKHLVKIAAIIATVTLTGCAAHHDVPKKLTSAQMSKNALAAMDSGGPLTSNSKSLADYTP
ncbi:hypothetical protein HAP94_16735 [Acidithiobacillus ferrivorans]|nr:hypothetical protein [Acidithiobacillus ferrivorans]